MLSTLLVLMGGVSGPGPARALGWSHRG
jgi:hypothetical protein